MNNVSAIHQVLWTTSSGWCTSFARHFYFLQKSQAEYGEWFLEKFLGWGDFVIAFNYGFFIGIAFSLGTIFYLLSMQDKRIYDRPLAKLRIDAELERLRKRRRMEEAQRKVEVGEIPRPYATQEGLDDLKDDRHITPLTLSKLSWRTIISDLSSGKLSVTGWAWTKKNVFFREIRRTLPALLERKSVRQTTLDRDIFGDSAGASTSSEQQREVGHDERHAPGGGAESEMPLSSTSIRPAGAGAAGAADADADAQSSERDHESTTLRNQEEIITLKKAVAHLVSRSEAWGMLGEKEKELLEVVEKFHLERLHNRHGHHRHLDSLRHSDGQGTTEGGDASTGSPGGFSTTSSSGGQRKRLLSSNDRHETPDVAGPSHTSSRSLKGPGSSGRSRTVSVESTMTNATELSDSNTNGGVNNLGILEREFEARQEYCKTRLKELRHYHSFLGDLSRLHSRYSQDLLRLSAAAHAGNSTALSANEDVDQMERDANSLGSIWRGLGIYLHHIGSDNEIISSTITDVTIPKVTKIINEMVFLERNLSQEGQTLISDMKEALKVYNLTRKERDKHKEKLDSLFNLKSTMHSEFLWGGGHAKSPEGTGHGGDSGNWSRRDVNEKGKVSPELGIRGRSRSEIAEQMARSLRASGGGTTPAPEPLTDSGSGKRMLSPPSQSREGRSRSQGQISLVSKAQAMATSHKELERNEEKLLMLLQEREDEVAEATDQLNLCREEVGKLLPRVLTDYDRVSIVSGTELKSCFSLISKKMVECHRKGGAATRRMDEKIAASTTLGVHATERILLHLPSSSGSGSKNLSEGGDGDDDGDGGGDDDADKDEDLLDSGNAHISEAKSNGGPDGAMTDGRPAMSGQHSGSPHMYSRHERAEARAVLESEDFNTDLTQVLLATIERKLYNCTDEDTDHDEGVEIEMLSKDGDQSGQLPSTTKHSRRGDNEEGKETASESREERRRIPSKKEAKLRMNLPSAAALAAAPPSALPSLPESFAVEAIDKESAVWFNAFVGRIYRDACASPHFHAYFCKRVASSLNKGGLPSYVEKFTVSKVEFGALPPILCNFKWEPHFNDADTNKHNHQHQPEDGSAAQDNAKFANAQAGLGAEAVDAEHGYSTVEVTADLTFRSGITIFLDTNVTLMGLKVKVQLTVEMVELSGKVKFGVTHTGSFMSFAEEPHLYIEIHSQVGTSENFRFQDVPQLADTIRSKARNYINKHLVSPNKHAFRLAWPRAWWPHGTRHFHRSETNSDANHGSQGGPESKSRKKRSSRNGEHLQGAHDDPPSRMYSHAPPAAGIDYSSSGTRKGGKQGHGAESSQNVEHYRDFHSPLRDSVYDGDDTHDHLFTPLPPQTPLSHEKGYVSHNPTTQHPSAYGIQGENNDSLLAEMDDDDEEDEEEDIGEDGEDGLITITTTDKESGKTTKRSYNSKNMPDANIMDILRDDVDSDSDVSEGNDDSSVSSSSSDERKGADRDKGDELVVPIDESRTISTPSLEMLTRRVSRRVRSRIGDDQLSHEGASLHSLRPFDDDNDDDRGDNGDSSSEHSDSDHKPFMAHLLKRSPAFKITGGSGTFDAHDRHKAMK